MSLKYSSLAQYILVLFITDCYLYISYFMLENAWFVCDGNLLLGGSDMEGWVDEK